jgi:integrase
MVYRGVRGGVEDRWIKKVRQPDGSYAEAPSKSHGVTSRWKARYVDGEGVERCRFFPVKREAEDWLRARLSEVVTGSHTDPKKGRITVADVHVAWEQSQGHIAKKTAQTRRTAWTCHVEPRWSRVSIADVKTSAIRSWVAKMSKENIGVPTIENAFHVLRGIMTAAVEDKRLASNPCDGVKLPPRKHADRGYLTHSQVLALSTAVARNGLVVRFLAYTGLRWGEMAALRVADFDMLRRRVNVSRSVTESGGLVWSTPKTWERRSVPFPAALAEGLAAAMVGKSRGDLVFTDTRGRVLRNSNWRDRVFRPAVAEGQADALKQRARELAQTGAAVTPEFPTITPHDLRHTAAALAVSAGANVLAVQRMLGHKDAAMTLNTYADLFDTDLDAVAGALDAAIAAAPQPPAESLRNLGSGGDFPAN